VQKGLDPCDFALVPFGGAGPHGNAMAMLAGCYPVIVPPTPGVLSALGFLYSDVKNEFAQTFVRTIDDADRSQIGDILTKLGRDARAWQREEGIEESRQRLNYEADVRFSNRPFGVKRFQTIHHHCSVDVTHGLVLLFGIGTKALPSWDSGTRWNNLFRGLTVID
jgi:N-methylhydantoinase A